MSDDTKRRATDLTIGVLVANGIALTLGLCVAFTIDGYHDERAKLGAFALFLLIATVAAFVTELHRGKVFDP